MSYRKKTMWDTNTNNNNNRDRANRRGPSWADRGRVPTNANVPFRKTRIGRTQHSSVHNKAVKRLMRDLKEIQENPLNGVAACPLESDLFTWHCNLKGPKGTPWQKGIFHMILRFPTDYPKNPPALTLSTKITHPNVLEGNVVCLDMLEPPQVSRKGVFSGWSACYSVQSILVQLQAFLFASNLENVLHNLSDPSQYDKARKNWQTSVTWAVDKSLAYKLPKLGHYPPAKPWPPFLEDAVKDDKDKDAKKSQKIKSTFAESVQSELQCYYSKQSFTEDCLGFGVKFSKNLRTGKIKSINCALDFIGLKTFMNYDLRLSSMNERFTHWIPLYIDATHGKKCSHLIERAFSMICTGSTKNFEPKMVLDILPKLLSTMILEILKKKKHASVKALHGYCYFHRLFILLVEKYPKIKEMVTDIVSKFIKDPKYRHKDECSNIGEMLTLLSVSDYCWADIRDAYLEEANSRSIFWILNKFPELDITKVKHEQISEEEKLKYCFESSIIGQRLLWYNVFFLEKVAHAGKKSLKDVAATYDGMFGRPSQQLEDMFLAVSKQIQNLNSYEEFYKGIGKPLKKSEIVASIDNAMRASRKKGYHGSTLSVLSPEQFAKENPAVNLDDLCVSVKVLDKATKKETTSKKLRSDEAFWQQASEKRWGFTEIPENLGSEKEPWKSLYLQNNLQDLVQALNDSKDFKRFYESLKMSAPHIFVFEITCFNPSNIKSKWFFLTQILTKCTNLRRLIIKKGACGLGIKGFKALAKGLNNNPGGLKYLVLTDCDINASCIGQLTKGSMLSGKLENFNLEGNPLYGAGAVALSGVLLRHEVLPNLEKLNLRNCQIDHSGANSLAEIFLVKRDLKIIDMSQNLLRAGLGAILKNFAYSTKIEEIYMRDANGSQSQEFFKLLNLTKSLRILDLTNNRSLCLQASSFKGLETNTSLEIMILENTNLSSSHARGIGRALARNKTLKHLGLQRNSLTGSCLVTIKNELDFISKDFVAEFHLESLDLSQNISMNSIQAKEHHVLGDTIVKAKKLKSLNLNQCALTTRAWYTGIGIALKGSNNAPLEKLFLRANKFGKLGMKDLAVGLKSNTVLKELDISGNNLGVLGGNYLADAIAANTGLKVINAYDNFVEIEGACAIAKALESNTTLEELDLGLSRIRLRGVNAFINLIESGKCSLKKLALKSNHIPDKAAIRLARAVVFKSKISSLALAGNYLSDNIRAEIALVFSKADRPMHFDLAVLAQVKDPERQSRSVYVSPLPYNVTKEMIKKLFYNNRCGACLSVSIYRYKVKQGPRRNKCYAFVEFSHPASVVLACALVPKRKNYVGYSCVKITGAGIDKSTNK